MDDYVIVVGSGNSGLVSALSLLNDGYKVLLLETNNNIGGLAKNIRKGRFEFNLGLPSLYLKDDTEDTYRLSKILEDNEIEDDIRMAELLNLARVITPNVDYTIPFGLDNFIKKMIEWVPIAEDSILSFIDLAKECREALNYVANNSDNIDYDYVKKEYNNFVRVSSYSVSKVLDALDMPIEAQEIINSFWILFGSTETEISFVEYAVFLINVIECGVKVALDGSYGVAMCLANKFLELGGEIRLNSRVVNLLVEDNKINGVRLEDGKLLYANKVIVNGSLNNVYGKLIEPNSVPRKALKNVQRRELGAKLFSVHLGLNRSVKELKLDNYMYLLYESLDSDAEWNKMNHMSSGSQVAIVHNNASNEISPRGTTIISLNTLCFDNTFLDNIDNDNYYRDINMIAKKLISVFEKRTKVRITDYIEEIEIVTPVDNVVTSNLPDGCSFGYKLKGLDNILPRILNKRNENYVEGLFICGGFEGDVFGYNSSLVSGIVASNDLRDMGGKDGKN